MWEGGCFGVNNFDNMWDSILENWSVSHKSLMASNLDTTQNKAAGMTWSHWVTCSCTSSGAVCLGRVSRLTPSRNGVCFVFMFVCVYSGVIDFEDILQSITEGLWIMRKSNFELSCISAPDLMLTTTTLFYPLPPPCFTKLWTLSYTFETVLGTTMMMRVFD